ncbi:MAG: hypothetical protein LH477_11475 [Nocardioides sp.]|nr:hypothetical protein [Nocardioides sp.]
MRAMVLMGCCLALLTGCGGPGPEESATTAADMREEVIETVRTVSQGLRERGVDVSVASGSYGACGLQTRQLEYAAGLRTTVDSGPISEQFAAAREVIEALGLPMVESDAPDFVSTDGGEDDLRVSANEARAEPGTLVVEVVRDCEDMDADVADEKLNEDVETIQ